MKNNKINLGIKPYIFLYCSLSYDTEINSSYNINNFIKLAKIILNNYGGIVYNNHINLNKNFNYLIKKANVLNIKFLDNDNNYYNFQDKDHSFVLLIKLEVLQNTQANINSNTGFSLTETNINKVMSIN